MSLSVDFETRSVVDLRKSGVYPYAAHPSTDVWCMAYAFGDEDPQLWIPGTFNPGEIVAHVQKGGELRAWNASFERVIWTRLLGPRYGFPVPALEQWVDTAAEAAAMALPRALEDAAKALGLDVQKDMGGHRLMLQMARPRKPTKTDPRVWWDDADKRERLYAYCMQDVRVERAVAARLRRLSATERKIYLLDQLVNDRGVALDLDLITAAQDMVAIAATRADADIQQLTNGAVESVRKVADLTRWLQHRGVETENVRKDTLRDLLLADSGVGELEREVIAIRAESAKSSTAKLTSMQACADADGRARGLLLYHGAATGRWSGRLIQPQNFPRPTVKKVEQYIPLVLAGEYDLIDMREPVLPVISSMLRSMLVASPGHRLVAADFAQIEARVVAWLAGQEDLVRLFASGGKIYETMAAAIYQKAVDEILKDGVERQIGKNTVLGCGFGMGWETFQKQVKVQTGISLTDFDAQNAVSTYRERFPFIPRLWYSLNAAAIAAVRNPGMTTTAGRGGAIQYLSTRDALWCVLPSRRPLCYMQPEIQERETPWGEMREVVTFMGVNAITRQWVRQKSYGGLWTENVVQAAARDLMAGAMLRVERAGYPVILTVHDEVVADVPEGHGDLDEFVRLVKESPRWAAGLPVSAEGWEGARYRK